MSEKLKITRGSGNVFLDLGFGKDEAESLTCFVFDRDKDIPKIMIDHKLFGQDRAMSYGVEIRGKDHPLLLGALASFSKIRALATEV